MSENDNDLKEPLNKNFREPKIRFPEFKESWLYGKLNEFLVISKEKNKNNQYGITDVLSVSGEEGLVNQIEHLGRSYAGTSLENYRVVHKNQVVYTKSPLKSNPYGIIKTNMGSTGIVSTLYAVYSGKENINTRIIHYYFEQNSRLNNYLKPLINKGPKNTILVSDSEALNGYVCFPRSIAEQEKIITIFDLIERETSTINKKIKTLKKYKSGFINDWFVESREPKKFLYELVAQKTSQLLTSHFRENSGVYPVYDAGGKQYTYIDFYNNNTDSIAIIKYGSGCGRTFVTHGLHSVLGTMSELVPNDQSMLKYIYAFTLSNEFKRTCHKYTEIGTTPNLYFSDYSNSKVYLPSKKEIKNFMSIFDLFEQLEAIYQCKTDLLNKVKKYLINSMFI